MKIGQKKQRPLGVLSAAFVLLALVAFAVAARLYWQQYSETHHGNVTIPTDIIVNSTDTPEETPPTSACANYRVAAGQPRKIIIKSIGVDACLQRVGVDQHHAIAVPSNIHLAGWYTDSVVPGAEGVSVIDGHVLGRYNDAVFGNLKRLATGDEIQIQFGDLSYKYFTVVDSNNYPVDKVMEHLFQPIGDGTKSQLALITCGGTFSRASQTYDKRIVVRTKLRSE